VQLAGTFKLDEKTVRNWVADYVNATEFHDGTNPTLNVSSRKMPTKDCWRHVNQLSHAYADWGIKPFRRRLSETTSTKRSVLAPGKATMPDGPQA
jgi:hypothetical protein